MSAFKGRKIVLPTKGIWNENWEDELAHCESNERRELLKLRKLGSGILNGLSNTQATAENLAWIVLWVRCFSISEAALAGFDEESEMMLSVLQRMSMEIELQVHLIMDPLTHGRDKNRDTGRAEIVERFRAYTAWCLWSDRGLHLDLLNPGRLKATYDSTRAKKMLKDPKRRLIIESLIDGGAMEYRVAQDGNLEEAKRILRSRLHETEQLLEDPSLSQWTHKLHESTQLERALSFFELVNSNTRSMPARMKELGIRHGYCLYSSGSMIIHGGSIAEFMLTTTDKSWFPRIMPFGERLHAATESIIGRCEYVYQMLAISRGLVWQEGQ